MKPEQIRAAIRQLELSERLFLVEEIWDAIAADNEEIPLPEWQRQELDRRFSAYEQGTTQLHDWQTVHESLRRDYK